MSLPPQYRSKKGRRPPFYPLQQQTHIDDIPIELLELSQCVTLRPYEDGTKEGGVRAWEREHESVIEWLYDGEGSPCLVDPRDPNQHSLYMTEFAFAARNRGQEAIRETYSSLSGLINGDHDFETKYVEPWKALDRKEQEETILKALSEKARNEEDHDSTFLSRTRLLAPEITLDNLCGQGLLDLLKTLAICAIDPSRLSAEPIFNEKVFRKLGIRSEGDIPLSRGDRALQDELLLRRHSVLASLIIAILDEIVSYFILPAKYLQCSDLDLCDYCRLESRDYAMEPMLGTLRATFRSKTTQLSPTPPRQHRLGRYIRTTIVFIKRLAAFVIVQVRVSRIYENRSKPLLTLIGL